MTKLREREKGGWVRGMGERAREKGGWIRGMGQREGNRGREVD